MAYPTVTRTATAATVLLLSLMMTLVPHSDAGGGCSLQEVKESAKSSRLGRWQSAAVNDTGVVNTMRAATIQAETSALPGGVGIRGARHQHVVESYSQLVNGNNYCVVFSIAGECNGFHCKSYECTTKGHVAFRAETATVQGVECAEQTACNIAQIRNYVADGPMPGGWFNASIDDDDIAQLHSTAASIAAVDPGTVAEAYQQVVAGFNYCILFKSSRQANCRGSSCTESLSCVAGAFQPLPHDTNNPGVMTRVGVECRDRFGLLASSQSSAAMTTGTMATSAIAVLFAAVVLG